MKLRFVFLVAVAVSLVILANALNNPFIFDDAIKISGNPDLRSLKDLFSKLIYPYGKILIVERNDPSRPLQYLLWGLTHAAFGPSPWAFRLLNIVAHAGTGTMVFAFIRRLVGESAKYWPWLGMICFLTFPITAGTAAYAYAFSDVLGALLLMFYLYFYDRGQKKWTLFALMLALLTRQSSVIALPLIIAWDFLIQKNISDRRTLTLAIKRWSPTILSIGLYLIARYFYFGQLGDLEGGPNLLNRYEYLLAQPWVSAKYLGWTLWPSGLSLDHPIHPRFVQTWISVSGIVGWVALAGALGWGLKKQKQAAYFLSFGFLGYVISLAPTSSIFPLVDLIAERRAYGGIAFLVAGIFAVCAFLNTQRQFLLMSVLCMGTLVNGGISIFRNTLFSTSEKTWESTLEIYPYNMRALNNLSMLYIETKRYMEAIPLLEKALVLYPTDPLIYQNLGLAAIGLDPQRNLQAAENYFKKSLELDPTSGAAWYNLGYAYHLQGRNKEAIEVREI